MYRDRVMRCEKCQSDLVQYGDRQKWRCNVCSAIVVASGELQSELGDLGAGLADLIDTSRLAATVRACPTCDAGMNQLAIDGVVFERCPKDHTLWFEAGELGKVREAIARSEPQPVLLQLWDRTLGRD